MKKDNLIEEMDGLIKQKARKSKKSIGSYYRRIIDYCKKRVGEK